MIEQGAAVPSAQVFVLGADGPEATDFAVLLAEGRSVVFGVPGAFTPTCTVSHLPGYRDQAGKFAAAGVDRIFAISVNDPFVMKAWGLSQEVGETITLVSDGNAAFAEACGLAFDGSAFGMGTRSKRYAMLVEDGVVKELAVEQDGAFEVSSAEAMLARIGA
jgi:glutaredoxin/glutathione-dependent peroxiredoxin